MDLFQKKNRVFCCDLHCLDILYKVRLLTLESLPPSVTEPTSHIQWRQTLYLPSQHFINLRVSNLGEPRCLKWTWSISIIRRARQFELIQDTGVSGKFTSTNSEFDPSGWVADIEQTVEPEARSLAIQDIGAILQAYRKHFPYTRQELKRSWGGIWLECSPERLAFRFGSASCLYVIAL